MSPVRHDATMYFTRNPSDPKVGWLDGSRSLLGQRVVELARILAAVWAKIRPISLTHVCSVCRLSNGLMSSPEISVLRLSMIMGASELH